MQHHGAPTRFLDWTRSPYVALHFALESGQPQIDAALWAIDLDWLGQRSKELLSIHQPPYPHDSDFETEYKYINRIIFADNNPAIIVSATPMQVNQRMMSQQGLSLTNLSVTYEFYASLLRMLLTPHVARQVVSKLIIKRDQRITFLEELHRMNIHHASLFPGIDGFAKSLKARLELDLAAQIDAKSKVLQTEIMAARKRNSRKST
jgi:hypothetical protein